MCILLPIVQEAPDFVRCLLLYVNHIDAGDDFRYYHAITLHPEPSTMNQKKHTSWWQVICVIFATIIIFTGTWWKIISTPPQIVLPSHKLPSPNAYDQYQKAANLMTHIQEIGYAVHFPNGSTGQKAFAQRHRILHDNQAALKATQEAFAFDFYPPTVNCSLRSIRELAPLLILEGLDKETQGDFAGATDSYLDAFHIGVDIRHGTYLAGGKEIQTMAREKILLAAQKLDAKQIRNTSKRMETLMANDVPIPEAIEQAKWSILGEFKDMFSHRDWRNYGIVPMLEDDFPASKTQLMLCNKRIMVAEYCNYMDQLETAFRQPYATCKSYPSQPKTMLARVYTEGLTRDSRAEAEASRAMESLALVKLALQGYQLEHSQYPDKLSQLIPEYISKVPDDPFGLNTQLKYKKSGDNYLLYSIGPDGKDDGGRPIPVGNVKHITESSQGDISAEETKKKAINQVKSKGKTLKTSLPHQYR